MRKAKPENFRLRAIEPSEAQIQAAILKYLSRHPRVAFAARFNSGAMQQDDKKSRRYIRFNTLNGCPDILGMLKGGRLLAVEVKRPSWKGPSDDREFRQQAFLDLCVKNGGVGLFARRIEDVDAAIREAIF